jgi:SAM-dependent methyltransferase
MDVRSHWDRIFSPKTSEQITWYQPHLQLSLELVGQTRIDPSARIIDVGAGDSTLVDDLLDLGFHDVTVLDASPVALQRIRERLGRRTKYVTFLEAELFSANLPEDRYDLWHDRALFHFMVDPRDRQRYAQAARRALKTGGNLVIATFAGDGPESCSGLQTRRYSPEGLLEEFGTAFELLDSRRETHRTPAGMEQRFLYSLLRKTE